MSDAERDLKLALRASMDINQDVRKHHDPEEDKAIHRLTEQQTINNAENQCEDRLLLGNAQGHSSDTRNALVMDVLKSRRCSGYGALCALASCLLGAEVA